MPSTGGAGGGTTGGGTATGGKASGGAGGACGTPCEGYQFCSAGKCLPRYESTRVQPLTGGSAVSALSAAVLTNKAQGDLILQLDGDVTLSAPGASMTAELHGSGYARYTSGGVLVWSRSSKQLFTDNVLPNSESPIALMANGDFAVAYEKYDPPTGPVAGTYAYRLGRVGGSNGNLVWEARYPDRSLADLPGPEVVVPRSAKSDFLTFTYSTTYQLRGDVHRVVDSGTAGTVTRLATSYAMGAAPSADGTTAWIWGAYANAGSFQLNPLITQTWPIASNPGQGGGDAYLLGAQDATTVGPWFTEGDSGVRMQMVVDAAGDIVVAAESSGYAAFNGGQDFFTANTPGKILAKIDHSTGQVMWQRTIPSNPSSVIIAPGNRIVTLAGEGDATTAYTLSIYSGSDGALLSTVSAGRGSTVGGTVIAAGTTELFVIGSVASAADFNPGAATETLGATPGLFVSRYSF